MQRKKWYEKIVHVLYPRRCPFCDGLLSAREQYLCRKCSAQLSFIRDPVCVKCGRPIRHDWQAVCAACRKKEPVFAKSFSPFLYTGTVQSSMMRFKYGGRAEYAGFYAEAIFRYGSHVFAGRERAKRFPFQADAILPVPIHPERYRKRGYNQAEELGRELSFRTGIPLCPDLVFRKKKTLPQKGLSGVQRRQNLSGAFAVKKEG